MSQFFRIHPDNPQGRLLEGAVRIIRSGGLIVYPTDSCYALGAHLGDRRAAERIRRLRGTGKGHHFTLVCRDLSEISVYARLDNWAYRLLRSLTPGPYTFVLRATGEVPRRLQDPKRRSIGIRVPDHPIAQGMLAALGEPVMSSTMLLPGGRDSPDRCAGNPRPSGAPGGSHRRRGSVRHRADHRTGSEQG